tara:strand:+ start:1633 stop:1860 length:228 start_codon:yes stop_codon:yes gene_type:complete
MLVSDGTYIITSKTEENLWYRNSRGAWIKNINQDYQPEYFITLKDAQYAMSFVEHKENKPNLKILKVVKNLQETY